MCGIFCAIFDVCVDKCYVDNVYENCVNNVIRRGPDCQHEVNTQLNDWCVKLFGSVLWLQGSEPVTQPVESDDSLFLYNGDIFDSELLPYKIRKHQGDTIPLLKIIESSKTNLGTTLEKLHGPYAFIYIDKNDKKIYFCRDFFGRRSLLIGKNNNTIVLTSVASKQNNIPMIELPPLGIYCIDFRKSTLSLSLQTWKNGNQHFRTKLEEMKTFLRMEVEVNGDNKDCLLIKQPDDIVLQFLNDLGTLTSNTFEYLLKNDVWKSNVDQLQTLLENAVEQRVQNQPLHCNECIKSRLKCEHTLIGVLFSGGLDCAIITLIIDKFLERSRQIDLLNVAFERNGRYETPDRVSGRETLDELRSLCPERKWNLMEIDVTQEELIRERGDRIANVIYPLKTILDESLGCALWFASRGITKDYNSPCRVLFVGMGADELFGGYTRHRAAYKRGGWMELTKELDNDWKNISHRNLARDDRIVSDHSRQLRTPYLDENVVDFVRNLPTWERCYPTDNISQGIGDKLLLRTLAYKLGLKNASTLRKRALQFGSRIANKNENGHDISPRL